MTEFNPRISISDPVLQQSKIIVGSFPTWSLSNSKKTKINKEKDSARIKNNEMPFFFGSSSNKFWDWYNIYFDGGIIKNDINSIQASLKIKAIGITDLIISCNRKDKSALDKHLTKRIYNHNFFTYPKEGEKLKILCTSKGLMNDILLNGMFFKLHPQLKIDLKESNILQERMIEKINGNSELIKNPFCRSLHNDFGGIIECISIPSPGSPYRRLIDFGCESKDLNSFLDNYLKVVFNWFKD